MHTHWLRYRQDGTVENKLQYRQDGTFILRLWNRQDGNIEIIHSTGIDEALIPRYTSATLLKSKSTYYVSMHHK